MFVFRSYVDAGGLMSYGVEQSAMVNPHRTWAVTFFLEGGAMNFI